VIDVSTEYDALFDEDNDSADLPKKLRAKIKELQKERDELAGRFAEIEAERRKQSLGESIAQRGLNPKIAAFVPADVEGEALDEWLNEYADVFGGQQAQQQVDPAAAEINRMNAVQAGAATPQSDIMAQIDAAESEEELMALLRRS
jgi:hypothetical protein